MHNKNKAGREVRKPKAEHNKKAKGQTPSPVVHALEAAHPHGQPKK
jgi:hypothetical protein